MRIGGNQILICVCFSLIYPLALHHILSEFRCLANSCSIIEAIELVDNVLDKKVDFKLIDNPRVGDHIWWITDNSKFIKDYFNIVENIRQTPRSIIDPFESFLIDEFSEKSKTTLETWMAKQAYLALGNLLTVCALEDIDACPIEGFEPKKYDDLLELSDKGLQSVLVLAVGYRADDDFFSGLKKVRRGVEEVVIDFK